MEFNYWPGYKLDLTAQYFFIDSHRELSDIPNHTNTSVASGDIWFSNICISPQSFFWLSLPS